MLYFKKHIEIRFRDNNVKMVVWGDWEIKQLGHCMKCTFMKEDEEYWEYLTEIKKKVRDLLFILRILIYNIRIKYF